MPTLLIMAAGIGSRFGGGVKQLAPVDDYGHIIMDYSIHDAIEAGFDRIVFIIRRDIEADFSEVIGRRIESVCRKLGVTVDYAFQSLEDIPGALPSERTKPWGTGQAVLAARALVDGPFAVINADDYYGKQAYRVLHDYLAAPHGDNALCMAGFILKNTLSDNGGVTRGICQVDGEGFLTEVVETSDIVKTASGAAVGDRPVDGEGYVSMNMWGFPSAAFMETLSDNFARFFREDVPGNPLKAEYLLPVLIGRLLKEGAVTVKVLPTGDRWYGVTYAEDRAAVADSINGLVASGLYVPELYGDLSGGAR